MLTFTRIRIPRAAVTAVGIAAALSATAPLRAQAPAARTAPGLAPGPARSGVERPAGTAASHPVLAARPAGAVPTSVEAWHADQPRPVARDTTARAAGAAAKPPELGDHLLVGLLAGAGVGAAFGAAQSCQDCMVSPLMLTVPVGAALGLLVGAVVYVARRH